MDSSDIHSLCNAYYVETSKELICARHEVGGGLNFSLGIISP